MELQKPGNSPGSGPEVLKRQGVAKERAVQKVCSEIRGVLDGYPQALQEGFSILPILER